MTKPLISFAALLALGSPALAQHAASTELSPGEIVAQAPAAEWTAIPAEDLLVMTLAPAADGSARQVVIQLMSAPFSQGWVQNIRTLARAGWYDDIAVNRVQDNYVVQWGDPNYDNPEAEGEAKPLPEGLNVISESEYRVTMDALSDANAQLQVANPPTDSELAAVEAEMAVAFAQAERVFSNPQASEAEHDAAVLQILNASGLAPGDTMSEGDKIDMISIESTQTDNAIAGWHERDSYAEWVEIWNGWPLGNTEQRQWFDEDDEPIENPRLLAHEARAKGYSSEVSESWFWPVHCYGMVGVGRGMSPDTGTGAELYTVIGHAPRHLDRNIALVGRIIEGMEYLSSLPRGSGDLGFYTADEADKRTPVLSVRVASELPAAERPAFEYLSTEGQTFARYADARANRRDPFFIVPAGGADVCNIPVPVRRASE
ncbi:peptidylprolyl isomerase [Qipengyuania qiaonensis]|uniref:peptidylprolyl isomerase n=1 Tax=Qipengyuania qiaonensis TaxID=2867240 RepID=UPI001FFDEB0C|nr:peptidylprolyl isomerase [Qipengyuania qiaonensis]